MKTINPIHDTIKQEPAKEPDKPIADRQPAIGEVNDSLGGYTPKPSASTAGGGIYPEATAGIATSPSANSNSNAYLHASSRLLTEDSPTSATYSIILYILTGIILLANLPYSLLTGEFNVFTVIQLIATFVAAGLFLRKEWARLVMLVVLAINVMLTGYGVIFSGGQSAVVWAALLLGVGMLIFLKLPKVKDLFN